MTESTDSKGHQRWLKFISRARPQVQAQLAVSATASPVDDESYGYESLVARSRPQIQQMLEEMVEPKPGEMPTNHKPKYGLVSCPDGEFPSVRLYDSPETMARAVKEMEGQDVAVVMFFGFVVPITKAPHRIIVLPDDTYVALDPLVSLLPADAMDYELEIQDDGFLGDPSLSLSSKYLAEDVIEQNRERRGNTSMPVDDDDDDFHEDDEEVDEDAMREQMNDPGFDPDEEFDGV